MPGSIINVSKLDVLEGDLNLSQLSYVNDSNYPFKYTINRHYYSDSAVVSSYICSDKELSFSIQAMNSYYDYVSVTPTSSANIKCFNTKMDVTEGKQLSISAKTNVTLVTKDTDVKIRNSLTGIDMTIGKIGIWDNEIYEKPTFHYSINVADRVNYKIFEKINNETTKEIIKNNPSENIFGIDSWDAMKYGTYNISIDIMIDNVLKCNLSHNFEKLKPPVQPIPTNSNLKQVMLHNKELEKEISYQNFRLGDKLKEKGINVNENESLSSLITKVEGVGTSIKRQSGFSVMGSGGKTTINISDIDLSKSVCWGKWCGPTNYNNWHQLCMTDFMSSNEVELSIGYSASTSSPWYYWEVLTFERGIKSIHNIKLDSMFFYGVTGDAKKTFYGNFNISNPSKCFKFLSLKTSTSSHDKNMVDIINIQSNSFDVVWSSHTPSMVNVYIVELL